MNLSQFDPLLQEKENTNSQYQVSKDFWSIKTETITTETPSKGMATGTSTTTPMRLLMPPNPKAVDLLRSLASFRQIGDKSVTGITPSTSFSEVSLGNKGTTVGTGSFLLGDTQFKWIGELSPNLRHIFSATNNRLRDRINDGPGSLDTTTVFIFSYEDIKSVSVEWELGKEPQLLFQTLNGVYFDLVIRSGTSDDGEYFDPYDCMELIQAKTGSVAASISTPAPNVKELARQALHTTGQKDRRKSIELDMLLPASDSEDSLDDFGDEPAVASRRQSISLDVLEGFKDDLTTPTKQDYSTHGPFTPESGKNFSQTAVDSSLILPTTVENSATNPETRHFGSETAHPSLQPLETRAVVEVTEPQTETSAQGVLENIAARNTQDMKTNTALSSETELDDESNNWKDFVRNYVRYGPESGPGHSAVAFIEEQFSYPLEESIFVWDGKVSKPRDVQKRELRKLKKLVIGMETHNKNEKEELQLATRVKISQSSRKGCQYIDVDTGIQLSMDEYKRRYADYIAAKFGHKKPTRVETPQKVHKQQITILSPEPKKSEEKEEESLETNIDVTGPLKTPSFEVPVQTPGSTGHLAETRSGLQLVPQESSTSQQASPAPLKSTASTEYTAQNTTRDFHYEAQDETASPQHNLNKTVSERESPGLLSRSASDENILSSLPPLYSFPETGEPLLETVGESREKLIEKLQQLELTLHREFEEALQKFEVGKEEALLQYHKEVGQLG